MKIGPRVGMTQSYRASAGSLDGAYVTRWTREINGTNYRFTQIKWDDGTWGSLARNLNATRPGAPHYLDSEDMS